MPQTPSAGSIAVHRPGGRNPERQVGGFGAATKELLTPHNRKLPPRVGEVMAALDLQSDPGRSAVDVVNDIRVGCAGGRALRSRLRLR